MPTEPKGPPTVPHPWPEGGRPRLSGPPAGNPAADTRVAGRAGSGTVTPPADRPPAGAAARPAVGGMFLGFRLVEEIGRGAFARVYLAEQPDLADRPVVLKVTADAGRESHALARLGHPNIVPIHSVHRAGAYQAVCMPYLGTVTLVDVYRDLEGMPTLPDSGRDLFTTLNTRRVPTVRVGPAAAPAGGPPAGPGPVLAALRGRSYADAVLWLAARLADGLAHAHARGVVHRDLKPANVLLADDGQPMLLDFNLAGPAAHTPGRGGGTPPYMSPEQLAGFAGRPRPVDARSDLYSLGVVVYELLTRRSPFPRHKVISPDTLRAMLADREGPPPGVRKWARGVSPAAEAIVRRCLDPAPARRYQSAADLKEDIDRHLADRPLRHTPDPSVRERARKWRRRNRVLAATGGLAAAFAAAVAVLAAGYAGRGDRLAKLEAADALRGFVADAQAAQVTLLDRDPDRGRVADGAGACEAALARFGVLDRPDWEAGRLVAPLPPADRARLREEVGRTLFLLAKATARRAALDAAREDPQPGLRRAVELTDAALACHPGRAVWEHRADLARLLGQPAEARDLARRAAGVPVESAADRLLLAHQHAARGEYRAALPLLREVTRDDPQGFVGWYVRGTCHLAAGQEAEAAGCFTACVALRPDSHRAWSNRGVAAGRARDFGQARADFDRAVALRPDFAPGWAGRGEARHRLGDHPGAVADLTRALDLGCPPTGALILRAAARRAAGDPAAAARDLADALGRDPADENGFVARGLARRETDPAGAVADFDAAVRLNPRSADGLRNKAAVLADNLGRAADALAALDEAVRVDPDSAPARADRGVLLARAGQPDRAVEDAQAAVRLDPGPRTLYRAGCAYALASGARPDLRPRAVQLVSAAVTQGFGHDLIDRDPDLAGVRGLPEFRQVADAARAAGGAAR